jgi:hypothetical protein
VQFQRLRWGLAGLLAAIITSENGQLDDFVGRTFKGFVKSPEPHEAECGGETPFLR